MKTQFLTQKFTDYQGVERYFTVAAVPEECSLFSVSPKAFSEIVDITLDSNENGECSHCNVLDYLEKAASMEHSRRIMFGVAICHPNDVKTVSEELGNKIAEGKARSIRTRIGEIEMTSGMFMTYEYINMCLRRFAELIARNPENYSISYAKAKEKYKNSLL